MKKILFIVSFFSILIYSCKDDTESLKNEIDNLKHIITLQNAFVAKKIIVSVSSTTIQKINYWNITFSDNMMIQITQDVVLSIDLDKTTSAYTVKLYDGQQFVFNKQEIVYPTGVVVMTQDIKFLKNTEVAVEFRVNPSNAIFNYHVGSNECQIAFDKINGITTYSYVTDPERFHLTRIEQAKDTKGTVKEGHYIAYIADNGGYNAYKFTMALVLTTQNQNGESIQLSSSAIALQRKKDTGLPIVVIHTENKTEIRDKENWINAIMTIDGVGEFPDFEGTTSIRGRGNSTWGYPKKPYALKLDSKSELLGMPAHKRWVLLANYIDRTLIRNHIAFEISRRTGLEWTVRGQFVEVMLNDVHLGNYYLCEQIKPDENRVNITEMSPEDLDEESISGGYVLEYDTYYDEINKFKSKIFDYPVMFKEPDVDVLQPEQFEYMQNYIDSLELLLTEPDFAQTRAYASLIADTTFIDWWFVMELTGNYEARHPKSTYFYKERNDVLKAGPVWDFDWGTYTGARITGFYAKESLYYSQLFKDPVFVNKVKARWRQFKPLFKEIIDLIPADGNALAISAELNDEMWSLLNVDNNNGDKNYSFRDAISLMSSVFADRLNWLDGQINNLR